MFPHIIPATIGCFIIVISAFSPMLCYPKENSDIDLDNVLEGFDRQEETQPSSVNQTQENISLPQLSEEVFPVINFSGSFSNIISYAPFNHTTAADYQIHGLTSFKPRLSLAMDSKLSKSWSAKISGWAFYDLAYTIQDRSTYSSEVLENYEKEMELGETFINGRLTDRFDISFGRQITVWGKTDFFRVADMVNPIDNRERGLDDIEFKRLPVLMTKVDSYNGPWHMSGIITHEIRYNKNPVYGNDFYPYNFPAPPREDLDNTPENSDIGLTVDRSYLGYDVAIYLGSYLKELDLVGLSSKTPKRYNSRLFTVAAAAEKTLGHWLFKTETAYVDGLKYYSIPKESMSRLDILFGTDYTGFSNTRLSLEMVNRHLFQLDTEIAGQENTPSKNEFVWAFRAARSFLREKLSLSLLSYIGGLGFTQGSAQNLSLKYAINDQTTISTGYIFVHSGDNYFMKNVGENDKFFLKLKYTF